METSHAMIVLFFHLQVARWSISVMAAPKIRVAVTQHEPVWLNLQATTDKTCDIIAEAASKNAQFVAFPECWVHWLPIDDEWY